jgi:hypothetical protein
LKLFHDNNKTEKISLYCPFNWIGLERESGKSTNATLSSLAGCNKMPAAPTIKTALLSLPIFVLLSDDYKKKQLKKRKIRVGNPDPAAGDKPSGQLSRRL